MQTILSYLSELKQNNNRPWYHAHKEEYKTANAAFLQIIQTLIFEIGQTDDSILHNDPKEVTFKLMRDTRFSHDKSPYRPAFRAHISSKGKLPIPVGYYLMIMPDNRSFLGGGLFADMFKDATTMIRDYITQNGEEWGALISDTAFTKHFVVKGAALKNVPRGYDPLHPQAEFLKNKSWYLECPVSDKQLTADDFIPMATEAFIAMQPFNAFLNRALADFQMPARP
ncbi:MAG: DUF2461 domain-containing protein [Clostridiales bacterium]|nr:DUF2461 domain-containing protein [Clostridiales bacterium]